MTSNLAASATSTSLWAGVVSGIFVFITGVVGGILSFVTANRRADAATAAADKAASASIEVAKEQAKATIEAAQRASGAEAFVPTSARYAEWQMHKRKIYEELLEALAQHFDEKSDGTHKVLQKVCDRALLVAKPRLREELHKLADDSSQFEHSAARREMVDLMSEDVEPPETPEAG